MVLISSCATEKTKPVVTDVGGEVKEETKIEEKTVEEKEVVTEEPEKEEGTVEEESQEEGKEEALPSGTRVITIKDLKLDPQELTIKKGDTVIWKHEDTWEEDEETRHYLAAHSNEFRTPILYYGDTFEHTFNKTGTFTYIDVLYKERSYMRGTIIVE